MPKRPDRSTFPYPWLKHGVRINDLAAGVSVSSAAKLAGLDDVVVKVPMRSVPDPTVHVDVPVLDNPDRWMTVSTRRVTDGERIGVSAAYQGTVGRRYHIVQNTEAFDFFEAALGKDAACIEAAGRLGSYGARTFMVAAMPEMLEIVPGDPVERFIMLTTTHDGSGNIEALFINWRCLSNSGLQHTTQSTGRVRIRHTRNATSRVREAHKILAKNQQYWDRAVRIYRYMAKRDVSVQRAKEFCEALFPDKVEYDDQGAETDRKVSPQSARNRERLIALFEGGLPGSDVAGRTDWALYNCVAYFVEHERTNRSKRVGAWEVSTLGAGAALRARAFNWLSKDVK
jgi:phage/plasmid-like protein (TIGR03299 family)